MENINCKSCGKDTLNFVKYIMKNNVIVIRKQCSNCGVLNSKNYKIALFNLDKLSFSDNKKREVFRYNCIKRSEDKRNTNNYYNTVYLKSDEWKNKRQNILKRDNFKCVCCLENKATQVHHITYVRLFSEDFTDLISVCKDCHTNIHFNGNVFFNGFKANYDILKFCYSCKKYHNDSNFFCNTCKYKNN